MYIERVILENIGRHKQLDVKLPCGLVGVFGPNGSGKSTLLEAIYAGLTNDFGGFDGPKTDLVNWLSEDKTESSIYLEAAHEGQRLELYRGLRPAKHSLRLNGGKAVTDANKLQPLVYETLGVDKQVLNRFVFKRQNKIYDFLDAIDSERKKAFQYICGTEHCEDLWKLLGDRLNQDASLRETLVDNSDELREQIAAYAQQLEAKQQECDDQQAQLLGEKQREAYTRRLERHRKCVGWEGELQELVEKKPLLAKAVRVRRKRYLAAKRQREQAAAALVKAREEEARLQEVRQLWQAYDDYLAAKQELAEQAQELVQRQPSEPTAPDGYNGQTAQQLRTELADLRANLKQAKQIHEKFSKQGVVACPTCGTEVAEMADHLAKQKKLLKILPPRIEELETTLRSWNDYEAATDTYRVGLASHTASVEANQRAQAKLKEVSKPKGKRESLKGSLAAPGPAEKETKRAEEACSAARASLATRKERLNLNQQRQQQLEKLLTAKRVPDDKRLAAEAGLARHAAAAEKLVRLEAEREMLDSRHTSLQEELARLQRKLSRNRRARRLVSILEQARDLLHRNELPAKCSQQNLLALEGELNEGLSLFGSPFTAEAAENLTFIIHKPGEPPQSSAKLSVGQRCVLAIAFWLSLQRVGMLALDEPTANLDEENQTFLGEALSALRSRLREQRQVFVVTHTPALRRVFDATIELS